MSKIDIFEEEWEDDITPSDTIEENDEELKHLASLMQTAIDYCKEATSAIEKLEEIDSIFEECGLGLGKDYDQSLYYIKKFYSDFIPSLILDDNENLVEQTSKMLDSSVEVGKAFIEDKRDKILNKMEEKLNTK